MARTNEKVGYLPESKRPTYTPATAASGVEAALRILEGKWKLVILFQLFSKGTLRFSELERSIPDASQKMLIQQLRALEADGVIRRIIYAEVPPRVEYLLTEFGHALCPAL